MIGRVVFVSAGLGVIVSLLTNPLLFFPLIVVPLAVLLVLEIRKMVKSAREVAQAEEQPADAAGGGDETSLPGDSPAKE